jgi:hypothetical protein
VRVLDPNLADVRAIATLQVANFDGTSPQRELHVVATDRRIVEAQLIVRRLADADGHARM